MGSGARAYLGSALLLLVSIRCQQAFMFAADSVAFGGQPCRSRLNPLREDMLT